MGVKSREEYRLRVFSNRVLRRIFGRKRDEMVGGWRKLCSEELHNVYTLPHIIRTIKSRRVRLVGHVAHMGRRGVPIGFWWQIQTERRPRRRWEDNNKLDLREIGWSGLIWLRIGTSEGLL
jgi:hypothetical protein